MTLTTQIHDISSYILRFDEPRDAENAFIETSSPPDTPELSAPQNPDATIQAELTNLRDEYVKLLDAYHEQQKRFECSIDVARHEWAENEGRIIAEKIGGECVKAFEALRKDVARVLRPFIAQKIGERSLTDAMNALQKILKERENTPVQIEGSDDLLQSLAQAIAQQNIGCEMIVKDGPDILILLPATQIETCIAEWMTLSRNSEE